MYSNDPPSKEHIRRIEALSSDVRVVVADSEATAARHAPEAEVILGHRYLWQSLPHTQCLKWVQSTAGGVAHLITPEMLRIRPKLTRCAIFADVIALHALALALSMLRRIPEAVEAQRRGEWTRVPLSMLPLPQTAMVLGIGCVGACLARLLRQHGLRVLGVARTQSPEAEAVCDELLDPTNWRQHLHRADLCFVALPLNSSTENLFDRTTLEALPRHAVLVNIGRGAIVDTCALAELLRAGHLGGAALDVLDPIPESPHDPLWSTPRLLITPKVAVFHPDRQSELEAFVEGQVKRYLDGAELLYPVDVNALARDLGVGP
jgi:phosphoglycerate dehydrogenase-like enzyme